MEHFNEPHKSNLRHVFQWQYSGVLIPLFYGIALALVALAASVDGIEFVFNWAYFFVICSFLWSLGYWLTSDTLENGRHPTRRQRRGLDQPSMKGFVILKWGMVALLLVILLGSLQFVYVVQTATELHAMHGTLIPASDPTPANTCGKIPSGAVILFYGDNYSVAENFPHIVLASKTLGPIISLDRGQDGAIAVIMDVRSADGKIVTSLGKDGFVVNPHNILKMNRPDKSSLIVTDEYGIQTLNVRYLNPYAIRIDGSFHYPGHNERTPIQIRQLGHVCTITLSSGGYDVGIP